MCNNSGGSEEESDRIGSDRRRNTVVLEDRMYTLVMYEYLFQILTMVGTYVSSGVSSREAGAIAPASMRPIWSRVRQALSIMIINISALLKLCMLISDTDRFQ